MNTQLNDVLTERDKIQVLLHEYDTLRTEGIYRNSAMFQLIGVGALLFCLLMQQGITYRWFVSLAVFLAVMFVFSYFLGSDITRSARRVRELERDINARAGEELLVWENRWSRGATGIGAAAPMRKT